jgi:hypothetical protein
MLVAVGLIMLMMILFATIFQLATGAMATQKGLTENDQRVRLVVTMLRNDLGSTDVDPVTGTNIRPRRTFKFLVPFAAGEAVAPYNPGALAAADPFNDRGGYFLISEGDPNDDTDDYIQFTITVPSSSNDRIFGRAAALLQDATGAYGPNNNMSSTTPPFWSNQPAFDAVFSSPILQAGSSNLAEVSYFLRNGTLYRRVMLIRTPASPPVGADDHSPTDDSGLALPFSATANAAYVNATKSLWGDFDYSVYYDTNAAGPVFHGKTDLTSGAASTVSTFWLPQVRWGFDNTTNVGSTPPYGGGYGLPKEYVAGNYIGRYTQEETSHPNFGFPATITNGAAGNPMAATNAALTFANGKVSNFAGGPRAGEDVLLTNVIAFDIKVWDPAASLGPDGAPGIANFDDDGNGFQDSPAIPVTAPRAYNPAADAPDPNEIGAYGSDDGDWRDLGHPGLKIGTNYYGFYRKPLDAAGNPNPLALPNQYYSNPFGTPPTNRYDTWGPAVEIDGFPANLDNPPFLPIYCGPDGRPGVAGIDDNPTTNPGIDDASELGTPGSDDFAPLTAIKITIRFYDVTSNQVRDISGVYRLVWEK